MAIPLLMPALSPTMTEGNLSKWHKKPGDSVAPGDLLAEIETDKATMEVEAVDAGTLGEILVPGGTESVAVGALIAVILEEGEGAEAAESLKTSYQGGGAPSAAAPSAPSSEKTVAPVQEVGCAPQEPQGRILVSPLARKTATQNQISLGDIKGSGPMGRIVQRDVEVFLERKQTVSAPLGVSSSPGAPLAVTSEGQPPYRAEPLTNMRKVIARRLVESKQTVPHFYLSRDVCVDALLDARRLINEGRDVKISVNDFVLYATARALAAHPQMNVAWGGDHLRHFDRVDLAVAVSIPDRLITPILRGAQGKSLEALSSEMRALAKRARAGALTPEEFQGGTFSVSNLGMFQVDQFSAILNPPHAGILAVGAASQKPIVVEGQLCVGTVMTLTLSLDHRAVDGALGAQFLGTLHDFLSQPLRMLL